MNMSDQIAEEYREFRKRTGINADTVHLHPQQISEVFRDATHEFIVDELNANKLKLLGMNVVANGVFGPHFSGTEKALQNDSKEVESVG